MTIAGSAAVLLVALGAAVPVAPAQGPEAAPVRVFVEVDGVPDEIWLQQPFAPVVRIGVDAAWLAGAAVPLFQQRLDQPFHVTIPWLFAAEDRAVEPVPPPAGAGAQRLAVGDRVLSFTPAGERQVDGRTFTLLELRCRWLPLASGASTVAPVQVRYAFATRFEQDFLRGRQPLDRTEATVQSPARTLRVRPLPQPAPSGFAGAVGQFVVRARTAARDVPLGGAFDVEVEIAGDGNLERFAPLPPPRLPGFHVQGVVERRAPAARTFVLDVLALRAGAEAVPPVPFVVFDPVAGGYATRHSEPVPVRVLPAAPGVELPAAVRALVERERAALAARGLQSWWIAALAALVLAVAAWWWRRRRGVRLRRVRWPVAQRELAEAMAAGPAPALAAFDRCLALALGHEASPIDGEAALAALAAAGAVDPGLCEPLRRLRRQLDAARFGGAMPAPDEVQALVARLLP